MKQAWSLIVGKLESQRESLVDAWLNSIGETTGLATETARAEVAALTDQLLLQFSGDSWQPPVARVIGLRLASLASGEVQVLAQTHQILFERLSGAFVSPERELVTTRLVGILGELAAGFSYQHGVAALSLEQKRHEALLNEHTVAHEVLRRNEAWLRVIMAGVPSILVAVDHLSIIKLIEGKTLQTLGISPTMLVGYSVEDVAQRLLPGEAPPILGHFKEVLRGKSMTSVGTAAGLVFETHYSPLRDEFNEIIGAVAVALDITERTRTTAELDRAHQQMTERVEAERLHLAHELHDDSLQRLIAVSYQLGLTTRNLTRSEQAERVPDGVLFTRIDLARQEVLSVVRQLRILIGELRPPSLDVFGLPAALETYVDRLRRTNTEQYPNFELKLDVDDIELPQTMTLCLFRVAQECVRNAMKYAEAQNISLQLTLKHGIAVLSIRDDGRGFRVPAVLSELTWKDHYGLVGLSERVEWNGGRLTLRSEPGHGTEVVASIPLNLSSF